jgi:hypothetical protein
LQIFKLELDTGFLEVTVRLGQQQRAVGQRAHHAHLDGLFRAAGVAGRGHSEPSEHNPSNGFHDRSLLWPLRPSLLSQLTKQPYLPERPGVIRLAPVMA